LYGAQLSRLQAARIEAIYLLCSWECAVFKIKVIVNSNFNSIIGVIDERWQRLLMESQRDQCDRTVSVLLKLL
jgi:hypothetical protein